MTVKIDKDKIKTEYNHLMEQLLDDTVDIKEKLNIVSKINFLAENTYAKLLLNSDLVEVVDTREME